jgi:archaellum biogenesis ATPase FlaH
VKEFLSYDEVYRLEEEERLNIKFSDLCTYGINALDDPLLAIAKNELVVIGADSGIGKSSIILDIARHNAKNGKKVALFYLEGGHIEAIQRMKWRDICDLYYHEKADHEFIDMDFRKWALNKEQNLSGLSSQVYSEQKDKYKDNFFLYPISEGFKIEELLESLLGFHKLIPTKYGEFEKEGIYDLDLIIIDHLQYFSLDKEDNEIAEITKIIREVKKITDHHHIPVILVSHLRKKAKDRGLPGQEDFYGSSNIPKIATTAITIAPDAQEDNFSTNIYPTFFRVVKSRIGIRPNYAIRCNYNLNLGKYENQYKIFRLDNMGNIVATELSAGDLPKWAR